MNLADFKRWHWIVVGLLAGLAFGGIRHWAGSDSQTYDNVNRTLNSQAQFEQGLTNTVTLAGGAERPVITDVVVYPQIPGDGFQPVVFYEATLTRQPFDPAQPDGPRKGVLYRNLFEAPVPYQPQLNAPAGAGPGFTVRDYLAHVKASGANITYRYAWWWEPRWNFLLCAAAGVVLIGGIWPSVVNLLIGAGLGPKPSPKLMDLSRYGKGKQTPTANAATTAGDKAKFDELEAA
ncbi:MAG TPA: hypothetical protein VK324_07925, partial [Tepidisphaeraceae bacterium]|nr:hypothetical protein [Tepidisphaeraceae bacterium]